MNLSLQTAAERQDRDQWKILGGLRFVLAFIVLCGHLARFVSDDNVINRFFLFGAEFDAVAAVFCFLIVSGFSIAHSIISRPEGFYFRRVVRIYPLYISALVLTLIPFWFAGPMIEANKGQFFQPDLANFTANIFFLQTFFAKQLSGNAPVWTLAVEVFFYLLAPIFFRMRSWMLLLLVLISATGWVANIAFVFFQGGHLDFYSRYSWGLPAFFLLWAWLGGFLFYRHREKPVFRLGLVALGVFAFFSNFIWTEGFTLFTYLFAGLIIVNAHRIKLPAATLRVLDYLGDLSYPLYLLHVPVLLFSYAVLGTRNAAIMVLLTLAVTAFVYHAIDHPIRLGMRRIHWLRPRRAGPFVPLGTAPTS